MAKKKTYEPAPQVPSALRERYATMLEVIQGRITVSDGARRLGMSRNHFQTLMHRAWGACSRGSSRGSRADRGSRLGRRSWRGRTSGCAGSWSGSGAGPR